LLARAEAFWRAGRFDESTKACRQVQTRHPLTIKSRLILGSILEAVPDRAEYGKSLLDSTLDDDITGFVRRKLFGPTPPTGNDGADVAVALAASLVSRLDGGVADPATPAPIAEKVISPVGKTTAEAVDRPVDAAPVAVSSHRDETDKAPSTPEPVREESPSDRPERSSGSADATPPPVSHDLLVAATVKGALLSRYGVGGVDRLERRFRGVSRELNTLGVAFHVVYVDDDSSLRQYGVEPSCGTEAIDIKRCIDRVIQALQRTRPTEAGTAKSGVLLVGGDDVVPFFRIPSPSDDDDDEIITDNPYGRVGTGSILAPDQPVGRLPDGSSGSIAFLLRQLDNLVEARRRPKLGAPGAGLVAASRMACRFLGFRRAESAPFAWAASDLETVAGHVVGKVAPAASIRSCPPVVAGEFDSRWLANRRCLHFSLNGRPGGDAWFGKPARDPAVNGWRLPLALTARELSGLELAAPVVFSAVGYSVDVIADTPTRSLSLRFLSEGAAVFIGSTSACYGSNLLPLAAADRLGSLFWSEVRAGLTVGVALRKARRDYVSRTTAEQGYLDGDDQKTLLQFVMLGDPLLAVFEEKSAAVASEVTTVVSTVGQECNHGSTGRPTGSVDPRLIRDAVKVLVLRYPEAVEGAVRIRRRSDCDGSCGQSMHREVDETANGQVGVTSITARTELSASDGSRLIRFARATLGADGRIVKTLVSR
jgi:hypothetical protein